MWFTRKSVIKSLLNFNDSYGILRQIIGKFDIMGDFVFEKSIIHPCEHIFYLLKYFHNVI